MILSGGIAAAQALVVLPAGPPTGLTATAGDTQVILSWTAPDSSTAADPALFYNVYEGTTANFQDVIPVAISLTTSAAVTGLANGTMYYFRVTAVSAAGEGPASAEASATPVMPLTDPGPPTGLTAAPGGGRVRLSWGAPASDGGSPVAGYIIYQATSPGGESAALDHGSLVKATSYTVTGLANGVTYYFKVAAVSAVGQGRESAEASATPVSPASSTSGTTSGSATSASEAPAALTAPAGDSQVGEASARPVGAVRVSPTTPAAPKQLIALLAVVSVAATAGAVTLAARGRRGR